MRGINYHLDGHNNILDLTCQRCGYVWKAKPERDLPNNCANPVCKSTFWDTPRKYKRRVNNKPSSGMGSEDGLLFGE